MATVSACVAVEEVEDQTDLISSVTRPGNCNPGRVRIGAVSKHAQQAFPNLGGVDALEVHTRHVLDGVAGLIEREVDEDGLATANTVVTLWHTKADFVAVDGYPSDAHKMKFGEIGAVKDARFMVCFDAPVSNVTVRVVRATARYLQTDMATGDVTPCTAATHPDPVAAGCDLQIDPITSNPTVLASDLPFATTARCSSPLATEQIVIPNPSDPGDPTTLNVPQETSFTINLTLEDLRVGKAMINVQERRTPVTNAAGQVIAYTYSTPNITDMVFGGVATCDSAFCAPTPGVHYMTYAQFTQFTSVETIELVPVPDSSYHYDDGTPTPTPTPSPTPSTPASRYPTHASPTLAKADDESAGAPAGSKSSTDASVSDGGATPAPGPNGFLDGVTFFAVGPVAQTHDVRTLVQHNDSPPHTGTFSYYDAAGAVAQATQTLSDGMAIPIAYYGAGDGTVDVACFHGDFDDAVARPTNSQEGFMPGVVCVVDTAFPNIHPELMKLLENPSYTVPWHCDQPAASLGFTSMSDYCWHPIAGRADLQGRPAFRGVSFTSQGTLTHEEGTCHGGDAVTLPI